MIKTNKSLTYGLITAFLVTTFDQLCKWIILHKVMNPPTTIEILPVFDLVLVFNRGISFGMLAQQSLLGISILIILATIIILSLIYWMSRLHAKYMSISIGFIIGGAIGNVIDRAYFGHVIDFLHFHWHHYSFPAFNIADSFITIGAFLIMLENVLSPQREIFHEN